MTSISNNNIITINRGDTLSFSFAVNIGNGISPIKYILSENSKLYLGVTKPNDKFENAIIKKVYTSESDKDNDENIIITFNPEDTYCLDTGKYYYEIKLQVFTEENEQIYTVQQKTEFWIVE